MANNYFSNFADKKCLVTGGAGFIGSNLARYLRKLGAGVKIIDNFSTGNKRNIHDFVDIGIEILNSDITNQKETETFYENIDFVFHHAAIASVPFSIKYPDKSRFNNVDGTITVLRNSLKNGITKVIFASSSAVYGDTKFIPTSEKIEICPQSPYAEQKAEGELQCKDFFESHNLRNTCLRYFNVFGPYQDPKSEYSAVIPKFIDLAIRNKDLIIFGDGSSTRDFVFVEDVIRANLQSALSGSSDSKIVNIATGQKISIFELAKLIIELTNSKSKIIFHKPRDGDIHHSVADITKASKIIKYNPKISLEEGLSKTVDFFKILGSN